MSDKDFEKAVLNFFNPGMGNILDLDLLEGVEPEPVWKEKDLKKVRKFAREHPKMKPGRVIGNVWPNSDWSEKEWQAMKKIIEEAQK